MATLVYQEGGKQYHPEKRLITHHDENKQHVAPGQNRTQTTLVGGKQTHAWGGEGRGYSHVIRWMVLVIKFELNL